MHLHIVILLWFIVIGIPLSATAAVPITVKVDSQSEITGTDCTTLSGANGAGQPYGALTIAGWKNPANNTQYDARVGTGCLGSDNDSTNDVLRLLTAVITSSDTNVEHTITFSGVYTAPPIAVASQGTQVWYKLSGQGNFKRGGGAATGSTVKAWGSIDSAAGSGVWTTITSSYLSKLIGLTPSFFGGTLSQPFPSPDISGNRTLKSVFKFTFKNAGDSLQLDNVNGIVVYSSSSPGEGDTPGIYVPHRKKKECPPDVLCLPLEDDKDLMEANSAINKFDPEKPVRPTSKSDIKRKAD